MNGYLEKLGSGLFGSYQKRYFRMDNFNLVYFEKESDAADGAKDVIDLHTVLHTGSGEKNKGEAAPGSTAFWVECTERLYQFRAPTLEEAQAWLGVLRAYEGCGSNPKRMVPIPEPFLLSMRACLDYLVQYGTTVEGIFRVGGSATDSQKLFRQLLISGPHTLARGPARGQEPPTVATVFKQLLRFCPESLFTNVAFFDVIKAANEPNRLRALICAIPQANQLILSRMIELFITIARNSHLTLMQPKQLAVCIGPNLVASNHIEPRPVYDLMPLFSTLMANRASIFSPAQDAEPVQQTSLGWYQRQEEQRPPAPVGSPQRVEQVEALDMSGVGDEVVKKKKKGGNRFVDDTSRQAADEEHQRKIREAEAEARLQQEQYQAELQKLKVAQSSPIPPQSSQMSQKQLLQQQQQAMEQQQRIAMQQMQAEQEQQLAMLRNQTSPAGSLKSLTSSGSRKQLPSPLPLSPAALSPMTDSGSAPMAPRGRPSDRQAETKLDVKAAVSKHTELSPMGQQQMAQLEALDDGNNSWDDNDADGDTDEDDEPRSPVRLNVLRPLPDFEPPPMPSPMAASPMSSHHGTPGPISPAAASAQAVVPPPVDAQKETKVELKLEPKTVPATPSPMTKKPSLRSTLGLDVEDESNDSFNASFNASMSMESPMNSPPFIPSSKFVIPALAQQTRQPAAQPSAPVQVQAPPQQDQHKPTALSAGELNAMLCDAHSESLSPAPVPSPTASQPKLSPMSRSSSRERRQPSMDIIAEEVVSPPLVARPAPLAVPELPTTSSLSVAPSIQPQTAEAPVVPSTPVSGDAESQRAWQLRLNALIEERDRLSTSSQALQSMLQQQLSASEQRVSEMDRRIVDLTHQHELEQTRWQQQLNDTKQQLSASQSAQQASMAQYQTEKQEMIAKLQSVALAQREMQSQHQTEKQQLQDYWQQQSKEHLLSLQQQLEASVQQRLSAAQSEFDHQHQMILGAREQEWNQVFDELKHRAEEAEAKFEASQKAEPTIAVAAASIERIELEHDLAQVRKERLTLEHRLREISQSSVDMQARLIAAEQERDFMRARYAGVEPELLQYQQRMQHEQTVRQQLSSEYETRVLQLQEENRALTQRAEEAEQAREQINQSNNILQQQLQQQMTGKSKDEVSQLESQRLKYEADIQRRLKAQQAAQAKQHAVEAELDRLRLSLHEWATDKQTLAALQRKLDEAAQLQAELVNQHQSELMRSHKTAQEAMQMAADAQRQRDAWRDEVDKQTEAAKIARQSEKVALDRLQSAVNGPLDELRQQLRETERERAHSVSQTAELSQTAHRLQVDLESARIQAAEARNQLSSIQSTLEHTKQALIDEQNNARALRRQVEDLKNARVAQQASVDEQLTNKQRQIDDLRRRLEQAMNGFLQAPSTATSAPPLSATVSAATPIAPKEPIRAAVMPSLAAAAAPRSLVSSSSAATLGEQRSPLNHSNSSSAILQSVSTVALQSKIDSSKQALQAQLDSSKKKLQDIESRARAGLEESKKRLALLEKELATPAPLPPMSALPPMTPLSPLSTLTQARHSSSLMSPLSAPVFGSSQSTTQALAMPSLAAPEKR